MPFVAGIMVVLLSCLYLPNYNYMFALMLGFTAFWRSKSSFTILRVFEARESYPDWTIGTLTGSQNKDYFYYFMHCFCSLLNFLHRSNQRKVQLKFIPSNAAQISQQDPLDHELMKHICMLYIILQEPLIASS